MPDRIDLIEPQIPALRRFAWALCRDHHAAEDLVQDCLERALSRWVMRRPGGSTRAWLFAILHNSFVSGKRQAAGRGAHRSLDEQDEDLGTPAAQEGVIALHNLQVALNALPEEQRTVLLLIGVEDMSYAEAAHVLDIPIGTVMSRLSRGRERLRQMMSGERSAAAPLLRRVK